MALRADARETELQKQWASDLRVREEEWERQAESRVQATETRLVQETLQKEELFLSKWRQREEQWQVKMDAVQAELHSHAAAIEPFKAMVARAEKERDEARQTASESARETERLEKKLQLV